MLTKEKSKTLFLKLCQLFFLFPEIYLQRSKNALNTEISALRAFCFVKEGPKIGHYKEKLQGRSWARVLTS